MHESVTRILGLIEEARAANELGNDQARAASVALALEGNDAMLACRLVAQGADPASLDYLDTGDVHFKIMSAHRDGPGSYAAEDPDLSDYLALCALSEDESQGAGNSVRGRFFSFFRAMVRLGNPDDEFREAAMEQLGRAEKKRIDSLQFKTAAFGAITLRVYTTDLGFAAGAWAGKQATAVLGSRDGKPYVAIGAPPYAPTLKDQGIHVDKAISPRFGIVEHEAEVRRVIEQTGFEV